MKRRLVTISKFLGLLLLVVAISVIPELIGGDLEEIVRGLLGDNYFIVISIVGVILIATHLYFSERPSFIPSSKDASQKVSKENLTKVRDSLLESYRNRLDSKLGARLPINLEIKYSKKGTTTKASIINRSIKSTKIKEELITIFDQHSGRLLMIGEPGSGKTTLLLQLAIQLIERGESQIPIIIDLATWRPRFNSVQDWLLELLPQLGFSKGLSNQFLQEKILLPLFDGLDELDEEHRSACLQAIGSYGKDHELRYVISSRISEYAETDDAPVKCQIQVKPLTISQIREGLEEIDSPETNGLLYAIRKDRVFAHAIKTPFYLNTAQLLFASSRAIEELDFKENDHLGRQKEIRDTFLESSFDNLKGFRTEDSRKWLAFLAYQMNQKSLISFELLDLQYNWTALNKRQKFVAGFIYGLVYGLGTGLVAGLLFVLLFVLLFGLFYGLGIGLFYGLCIGLCIGLVFVLVSGLDAGLDAGLDIYIRSKERVRLSIKGIIRSSRKVLFVVLFFVLFYGLGFGLGFGLVAGLGFGLVAGLIIELDKSQSYLKINKPYKRFISSMWALYFSILQHFHLRRILFGQGLLPKKLLHFLKEAADQNILETDGGSWRFRHKILMDYFVECWKKKYAAEYDKTQSN